MYLLYYYDYSNILNNKVFLTYKALCNFIQYCFVNNYKIVSFKTIEKVGNLYEYKR